jgi:hypothetical protein
MGCIHSSQSNSSIFISKECEKKLNITKNKENIKETKEGLLEELTECSICLENISINFDEIIKTDCSHYFHKECLKKWFLYKSSSCPLCRKDLSNIKINFNSNLNLNPNPNKKYVIGKNYKIIYTHSFYVPEQIGMLINIYKPNEYGNSCLVFKVDGFERCFFDNIYNFNLI